MDLYDFKWIKNIGSQIVKSVEINCGRSASRNTAANTYLRWWRDFGGEEGHFRQNDRKRGG
jgi:hypothetical protein